MVTMEIGKREFLHYTEKYLKEGEFVVTKHGVPEYVVTIRKVDGVVTKEDVVTNKDTTSVVTVKPVVKIIKTVEGAIEAVSGNVIKPQPNRSFTADKHGCGCVKKGSKTCPKHYCF